MRPVQPHSYCLTKGVEKIISKTAKELAKMQEEVISYINVSPISLLSEN